MFDNIVLFTHLVEVGNFSKTAEILYLSPSTLTRKIQELEAYLNKPLLIRNTRNLQLSNYGKMIYLQFKDLRTQLNALCKNFNDEDSKKSGVINIILPIEFSYNLITPFLSYFTEDNPEIKLNIYYDFRAININSNNLDIIITREPFDSYGYTGSFIRSEAIKLYCAPQYAVKNGLPIIIEDLNHHNLVGIVHPLERKTIDFITFTNQYTHEQFLYNNLEKTTLKTNMGLHNIQIGLGGEYIFGSWQFLCSGLVKQGKLLQVLPEWHAYKQDYYLYSRKKSRAIEQTFINFITRCINGSIELAIKHKTSFVENLL